MSYSTEYRDAYCWFYGRKLKKGDNFDELVNQKIHNQVPQEKESKPIVQFQFEVIKQTPENPPEEDMEEEIEEEETKENVSQKSQKRSMENSQIFIRNSFRHNSPFENYGRCNMNNVNPNYDRTTFNIKAQTGVNPNTKNRAGLRGFISSEYAHPKPNISINVHRPHFISNPTQAKNNQQIKGPYWVYGPSESAFPPEYHELEQIVRPRSK